MPTRNCNQTCLKEGLQKENLQKWLGEGAKGLWSEQAKVFKQSTAPSEACFAPMQPHGALVQEAFRSLGPKYLFCPRLTPHGNPPFLALS